MDRLRAWVEQIGGLFRRGSADSELDEEFQHHLDMETAANLRAGMSPQEARRRALLAFGGTDWHGERVRDEWWGRALEDLARDLRFGARNLGKRIAFTVSAVLTLGIGIGMTTTMFVLVDAILLRPLPGANAKGMVYLELEDQEGRMTTSPTPQLLRLVRDHARSFTGVEAFTTEDFPLVVDGEPLRAKGARASVGFFNFLGVKPALGRLFVPEDGLGTTNPVVVLSHTFWEERFGRNRAILGSTIRIGDRSHEIIGVLPRDFRVDMRSESRMWIPAGNSGALFAEGAPVEGALGKLAEGTSLETAQAELNALVQNNPLDRRASRDWVGRLRTPTDPIDPSLNRAIFVLQAAAVFVLLVGCVNLTNLLLAQGEARAKEFALRASLGARRGRLLRQLLGESLLLGAMGGLGGILLTLWALGALPLFLPPGYGGVAPGRGVFLLATAVSLAAVLVSALLPALRGSRRGLADVIKGGASPAARGRARVGVRQVLVTAEVAMTVLLLVGAGLLLKSFARLSRMDPGFDSRDLLSLHVQLPEDRYPDAEARETFLRQLEDRVGEALPEQLGTATLSGGLVEHLAASFQPLAPQGVDVSETDPVLVMMWDVAPGFFDVLGVPILEGRAFVQEDARAGEPGVIINETVASRYFPDGNAVGRLLRHGKDEYRVIGVSGSLRLPSLARSVGGAVQLFFPLERDTGRGLTILTRLRGDRATVVDLLKETVWRLDPGLPVQEIAMVDDQLADSLNEQRSNTILMVLFSLAALLLGAVGVYGVVAYSVSRRVQEMGIRLALGASPGDVVSRLVVGGMGTVGVGLILGVAGALALGSTVSSLLFEVDPSDPTIFAVVIAVTTAVSLLSTWLPARRAAGLSPVGAMGDAT